MEATEICLTHQLASKLSETSLVSPMTACHGKTKPPQLACALYAQHLDCRASLWMKCVAVEKEMENETGKQDLCWTHQHASRTHTNWTKGYQSKANRRCAYGTVCIVFSLLFFHIIIVLTRLNASTIITTTIRVIPLLKSLSSLT